MNRRALYAYYYPAFHRGDLPWCEWDLVRAARPWFPGHEKPDTPLWGELDDTDPATFVRQALAAHAAGIDGFVFDVVWRPDGAFLHEAVLERAVLPALASGEVPEAFRIGAIWCPCWPRAALPLGMADPPTAEGTLRLFPFAAEDLVRLLDRLRRYLAHPRAIHVASRPFLAIFHAWRLVAELGEPGAAAAVVAMRRWAEAEGLGGLFLVGCVNQPSEASLLAPIGLDALSSYVWWPDWNGPPRQDYRDLASARRLDWERLRERLAVPYLPSVAAGWDATPRGNREWDGARVGFPWTPVVTGNTPAAVAEAVAGAVAHLDASSAPRDFPAFIASWNEWSESHRLEPCRRWGDAHLRAIAALRSG